MTENMKKMMNEKYAGSTVLREDANGIVLRNSSGALEKVSESMAHQYNSGSDMRAKQQHTAELATKARENVAQERQLERQLKQQAQNEISASIQRQRDRRDSENKLSTDYRV